MNTKTKGKTKTQAPADCRVIVTVSGGVAGLLSKPEGMEVCILDYDVDGEDVERMSRDPDGQLCCIQRYVADEKVVADGHWLRWQIARRPTPPEKEKPA